MYLFSKTLRGRNPNILMQLDNSISVPMANERDLSVQYLGPQYRPPLRGGAYFEEG